MKFRSTLVLALGLSLGISFAAAPRSHAQAAPASDAAKKLEAIAKQLNLSPEQKAKLLPVLEEEAPKLKALKSDTSLTGMQKLEKLRAIHQQTDPKVKAILTEQQYEQWTTMRQQEVQQMIEKKRG